MMIINMSVETYFNNHAHTYYSNLRILDCINHPADLIDKAIELGMSGICITDHESLSAWMEVNQYAKTIKEKYPNFKIGLGNEIYLTENREPGQKYYHFILIAKDIIGARGLKELSSIAWYNMYVDRGMERVPTLMSEVEKIMPKYKGHIVATTACIGSRIGSNLLGMAIAQNNNDNTLAIQYYQDTCSFVEWCIKIFGKENFYIECAPSDKTEQITVNKKLRGVAKKYNLKMSVGTDAHYLEAKDRFVHKAYLNSRDEDRETDDFYTYTYLMSPEECRNLLLHSFNNEDINEIFENSNILGNSIEEYSLERQQHIPEVKVKDYPKREVHSKYNILNSLYSSDNCQERYWVNECIQALKDKGKINDKRYLERLEEEARVKRVVGGKLHTCMFAYPNTLQHYIDLFWRCGSTVGAGRGSSCSGLNHYLLGITQLDPIEWELPFWRYLNDERVEIGDIDLDLAPSKLQKIFQEIRKERGELGLVQVCTFSTEATRSSILTACRGYRSVEYPEGIDVDEAQYLSSLVPSERGLSWSLKDLVYGDPDKEKRPSSIFINEVNKFPGLLDIMFGIEGIVKGRGSHASGVILYDENIYDTAAIMRTSSGAIVTQWDLHMQEKAGDVKYDFLLTDIQDIIIKTIELLQQDGIVEQDLSLREIYNKYLHPNVLPQNDEKMWSALAKGKVLSCFQFDSAVGAQAAKKIKPHSPLEMSDANGLMRLMANEETGEMPLDKYVRFKNNISLWYEEMDEAGLTKEEEKTLEPYFLKSYGVPPSQEQLMQMLMDENICHFTLAEANAARKIVGKKQMSKIPELHKKVLAQAKSLNLGKYVWECGIGP